MRALRVVQVPRRFTASSWGGTETVILETARQLRARGHQIDVLSPDSDGAVVREHIGGVPVWRFSYFYPYVGLTADGRRLLDRKGGNIFSFGLMRALSRWPRLDLIHLHTGKRIGGIGRRAAQKRRLPYVISLHGGMFDVPEAEAASWIEPSRGAVEWGKLLGWWVGSRKVLVDADAIICVGRRERDEIAARFPGKRVAHIPHGVDCERFARGDGAAFRRRHGIPEQAPVLLNVGRIDPQKNQLLALSALRALSASHQGLHLVLVGHVTSDAYRDRLVREAAALGVRGRLTLLDSLPAASQEVVDAYHAADLFLLTSTHEPFGIVVLEAWAAGLPVVASRVGGVASVVQDGFNGALFDPGDPPQLVRELDLLLGAPERARELAANGQRTAKRSYSWGLATDRLLALYEEVLSERSPRP